MLNRKVIGFLLGGLVIGLLVGFLVLSAFDRAPAISLGQASRGPARGLPLADVTLAALDGEPASLSQFKGKAVVVNFWASWCGPCKEEMPLLQSASDAHADRLVVLGVNEQESAATARYFADQNGITFPILLDEKGEAWDLYRLHGLPTTFFLDAEGVLQAQHIGQLNQELLDDYLEKIGVEP